MRRTSETVDAAVLAPPVRIDRAIEPDVGRIVARDHLAGGIDADGGLERRQVFEALPAVVKRDPLVRFIAAAGIGMRATASPAIRAHRGIGRKSLRASACSWAWCMGLS